MKNRKKNYLFLSLILFFLSFLIFFIALFLNKSVLLEKNELFADLIVGEIPSFNVSDSTLSFGTITSKTGSGREIFLKNEYVFPVVYFIESEGNISRFLIFEEAFILNSGEEKKLSLLTIIPEEEDEGYYSGKIIVILKRKF